MIVKPTLKKCLNHYSYNSTKSSDQPLLYQKMIYPRIINPSLYLFELSNENADSQSPINEFIQKAKLTAFGFCSRLI